MWSDLHSSYNNTVSLVHPYIDVVYENSAYTVMFILAHIPDKFFYTCQTLLISIVMYLSMVFM